MTDNDNERGVGERGVDKELAALTHKQLGDFHRMRKAYYSREEALAIIEEEAKPKQRVTYKRPEGEGTEETS